MPYTVSFDKKQPLGAVFLFAGLAVRGAEEKKRKKRRTYLPTFLRFFEIFRSDFRKHFNGVFGLLMQRNGRKRDKKNRWGKTKGKKFFFPQLFRPKAVDNFDMDFPQNFLWCF
jgi:hypothetical protein